MQQYIHDFENLFKKGNIYISNEYLKEILYKFDFIFYQDILQIEKKVKQYENNSKIIIIDECIENSIKYYILCFDYKLIILPQEDKTENLILHSIFTRFEDNDKYNLQSEADENFLIEIRHFSAKFMISNKKVQYFWSIVVNCLSGFLIKKGYRNSRNRNGEYLNEKFIEHEEKNINFANKSYIELRNLGHGSGGTVNLIYYIPKEQIFALKIPYNESYLIERERRNYLNIRYPFIVQYIGYIKFSNRPKYLLLEYVEGETLDKYDENRLSSLNNQEKYIIILELLLTINYLHSHNYIYRDLRLSNIMINQNKDAILIDFDRVRKINDETENEEQTKNFYGPEVAPEEYKTYKSDAYSLGYIIYFILYGKSPIISNKMKIREDFIFKSCLKDNPTERPNIIEMIKIFYAFFFYKIQIKSEKVQYFISLTANQNFPEVLFNLGVIYSSGEYAARDINQAIHYFSLAANQNIPQAQFNLGVIYLSGEHVTRDINKAIHYFSLAANQNFSEAQYNLGVIYLNGKYVTRDINKAIHFFSLVANQSIPKAQYNLGVIYGEGLHATQDINKAIHYYSLAANQNYPQAQFNLGVIYSAGRFVARDINKAIYYFSLAANQNFSEAQFNLGVIYSNGEYVTRDINKAIHYFSLAANQNFSEAQFNLGDIYSNGEYVTRDINKAIHYYSLAANQNHSEAQYNLGVIYDEGLYVTRDINKAIHYYSHAANQNFSRAQFNLGVIYDGERYVTRDISKAIHYYSLASNQNHSKAQINLGLIYYEGRYVTPDINKAIHYFSLAAKQNYPEAQFNLGSIYLNGKYVVRDINKAIHYYSLAADQNTPQAEFNLGVIYLNGKYVVRDINKAIHYFSLASNQNYPEAQFNLGIIYYIGEYIKQDIKKGRYYIMLASKNGNRRANFAHGFLLQEGICAQKDIAKAIHYYKEASSFNNQFSKNNLGIIYKHGYNEIEGKTGNAIEYFEEAIRQKNDYLSMYNLAHIYMYDATIKQDLNKSIDLLIRSMSIFQHSYILLSLALLKQFNFNIETIKIELSKRTDITRSSMEKILKVVALSELNFDVLYELYRSKDYIYNIKLEPIEYSELEKINEKIVQPKYPNAKDISSEFFKGFGEDLYASI